MLEGQQLDGMADVEHGLVLASTAFMLGDDLIVDDDPKPVLEDFQNGIPVRPLRRHRVAVRFADRLGELVDPRDSAHTGSRKHLWQRPQLRLLSGKALADRLMVDRRLAVFIVAADARENRNGTGLDKEIAPTLGG
jgi:hypothetical protein